MSNLELDLSFTFSGRITALTGITRALQLSFEFHSTAETLERLEQFIGALISFVAIFAQRFVDNLLNLSRDLRNVTRKWRWVSLKDRMHRLSGCFTGKWRM